MKKKILALSLSLITLLTSAFVFTGCGEDDSPYASRPITVELAFYYAGYGDAHYQAIAKDFMENCNDDIYLKLVPYDDSTVMRSNIIAGTQEGDIIELAVDMFRKQNLLEDLSDVYDMKAYGEEVTINSKDPSKKQYFTENVKGGGTGVFQFPAGGLGSGYNFAYNVTTLNEIFPNGYTLPRTTDEFFAFGDEMYKNNAYLTSAAIKDIGGGDYMEYLYPTWFAQLAGLENYNRFYKGQYFDGENWVLNESSSELKFMTNNKDAIEYAYEICDRLLRKNNKYLHNASAELDYLDNDKVFAGAGYRTMKKKTGFLVIGQWLETELEPLVSDGTIKKCEYGAMRVPVASSIVNLLDFVGNSKTYAGKMDDVTLSAIIAAIDEGKTYTETKEIEALKGQSELSEKDFNRIYEARKMVVSPSFSNMVVPKIKDESKREAIYEVLRYLASNRAQKVCAEALGGNQLMPFGKVDESDLNATVSRFISESNAIVSDMIAIDTAHVDDIFNLHVTVKWYHIPDGRLSSYIYSGNAENLPTPQKMYETVYSFIKSNWDTNITTYKNALKDLA